MYFKSTCAVGLLAIITTACTQSLPVPPLGYGPEPFKFRYTEPEESGLIGVRPFPNAGDVCLVIGENAVTIELLDDSATLIGCPKHERGAISDRMSEGASILAHAKHWSLLSVPN